MAVNIRLPDGRDLDVVYAVRLTSPLSTLTGFRGPDGLDINNRYEKWNGSGAAPTSNLRDPFGNDLSTLFTTTAHAAINGKDFTAAGWNPETTGSAWGQAWFQQDGFVRQVNGTSSGGDSNIFSAWNTAPFSTVGDSYEIMFNEQTGTITGPFGTWFRLDATRGVSCTQSSLGGTSGQCKWWIRRYGETSAHASGMVYLSAQLGPM